MAPLYLHALWQLLRFEYYVSRGDFALLCRKVREYPRFPTMSATEAAKVCRTMDLLIVFYPKRVLCLQRSAATTCLLRHCGLGAQMVIGVQQMPFRAHAWVEVEGRVINDRSYAPELFATIDRW